MFGINKKNLPKKTTEKREIKAKKESKDSSKPAIVPDLICKVILQKKLKS